MTGLAIEKLKQIGVRLTEVPPDFHVHRTVQRFLDARRKAIETGVDIDWATAESLAFGSLLEEGHRVRLSGQDSERGTFSQRHSVLFDQETEERYIPLNHLAPDQARFEVINSMLSEEAVLGFEYGYSLAEPNALMLWEAQFGDFVNGAQVVIDQFISSGETQVAAHVGAGDAASARLRGPGTGAFLGAARALPAALRRRQHAGRQLHDAGQLFPHPPPPVEARVPEAADPDDAEVAAPPQARGVDARRDGAGLAPSTACSGTTPSTCTGEKIKLVPDEKIRRVVLCSGKVYYDLYEEREKRGIDDIYLLRARAALSVPGQGADHRAVAFQERRGRLVPGGAQEHGRLVVRRALSRMGAGAGRRQEPAAALCRPRRIGGDRAPD